MAIEIKELHVKLHIGDTSSANAEGANSTCNGAGEITDKEVVIEETVKEVLRILKEQKER